jgi:hypothetical protein
VPGSNLHVVSGSLILGVAALALACRAIEDGPPVRNPLAETPGATVTSTLPAASATATRTLAAGAAAEAATAQAIEAMAGWLGVPQRDLTPQAVEVVDWPDACLGVKQPLLCAQVVTPGYRVRLEDALGAAHTVHIEGRTGRTVWAGEVLLEATVTSVDATARRVTVQAGGRAVTLRIAPGTTWFPEDGEAQASGKRARVAYDPAGTPGGLGTVAWVALEGS